MLFYNILQQPKGENMPTVNIYLSETEYVAASTIAAEKGKKITELIQETVKEMLKEASA